MQVHSMGPFSLEQRRRQRKTGGCKNIYVIYVNLGILYTQFTEEDQSVILADLNKQAGPSRQIGPWRQMGWIFTKKEPAERVWVYLTLKWC
jgi:hypothetical protein